MSRTYSSASSGRGRLMRPIMKPTCTGERLGASTASVWGPDAVGVEEPSSSAAVVAALEPPIGRSAARAEYGSARVAPTTDRPMRLRTGPPTHAFAPSIHFRTESASDHRLTE